MVRVGNKTLKVEDMVDLILNRSSDPMISDEGVKRTKDGPVLHIRDYSPAQTMDFPTRGSTSKLYEVKLSPREARAIANGLRSYVATKLRPMETKAKEALPKYVPDLDVLERFRVNMLLKVATKGAVKAALFGILVLVAEAMVGAAAGAAAVSGEVAGATAAKTAAVTKTALTGVHILDDSLWIVHELSIVFAFAYTGGIGWKTKALLEMFGGRSAIKEWLSGTGIGLRLTKKVAGKLYLKYASPAYNSDNTGKLFFKDGYMLPPTEWKGHDHGFAPPPMRSLAERVHPEDIKIAKALSGQVCDNLFMALILEDIAAEYERRQMKLKKYIEGLSQ